MTRGASSLPHHAARAAIGAHFAGRASPATETAMRAHMTDCSDCRGFYKRHHLLARLDPAALPAEERIGRALGFRARRAESFRARLRTLVFPTMATACVALAVLVIFDARPNIDMGTLGGFPNPPAMVRAEQSSAAPHAIDVEPIARDTGSAMAKTPHLLVYRFAPGAHTPALVQGNVGSVGSVGSMRNGDELAFAYTNPAARRYVAIFGVDDHQRVYWFHPAWREGAPAPAALPAAAGPGPFELPEAIRHAIDGRRLAIHALFADRAVGVEEIEAAVRSGASGVALATRLGGDVAVVEHDVDVSR